MWSSPLVVVGVLLSTPSVSTDVLDASLARATTFLVSRQAPDGSWRSTQYGAFKDGFSQTPFVLSALHFSRPSERNRAAFRKGVEFLSTMVGADGKLQTYLNYPVYAAAGTLFVLRGVAPHRYPRLRRALVSLLRSRQLSEAHGWAPDDPSYGGWGYFTGPLTKPGPGQRADHLLSANLSATLFAIGALQLAETPSDDPLFAKARRFVERCQNWPTDPRVPLADGGFFFTPANALQNKATADNPMGAKTYRSYGSMTADGLRALARLGLTGHPRFAAATKWFRRHFDPNQAPGAYPELRETQRASVYYYWSWTAAHALRILGDKTRLNRLAAAMVKHQQSDGAWRNPYTDLREDDPLVATPFAMSVLAMTRMINSGRWRTIFTDP